MHEFQSGITRVNLYICFSCSSFFNSNNAESEIDKENALHKAPPAGSRWSKHSNPRRGKRDSGAIAEEDEEGEDNQDEEERDDAEDRPKGVVEPLLPSSPEEFSSDDEDEEEEIFVDQVQLPLATSVMTSHPGTPIKTSLPGSPRVMPPSGARPFLGLPGMSVIRCEFIEYI